MKKVLDKLDEFEDKGYCFLADWTMDDPIVPERVKTPSGLILSIKEIEERLRGSQGSLKKELEDAMDYYDLARELNANDRNARYPSSFMNMEDIENCKGKYKSAL